MRLKGERERRELSFTSHSGRVPFSELKIHKRDKELHEILMQISCEAWNAENVFASSWFFDASATSHRFLLI